MNQYTTGNLVRVSTTISATATGVAIDPTTLGFRITTPDGVVADLSAGVVRDAAGAYHCDYIPTQVGVHLYEWIGTGAAIVAAVGRFNANQATF